MLKTISTLLVVAAMAALLAVPAMADPAIPVTTIDRYPDGHSVDQPDGSTRYYLDEKPKFGFTAHANTSEGPEIKHADFECSLDGAPFERCKSPKSYNKLSEGDHLFLVRAINDGVVGPYTGFRFWIEEN